MVAVINLSLLVLAALAKGIAAKQKYTLSKVIDVEGRQGITTNGTHYFVSGSTALYVYDLDGKLLASNEDPFVDFNMTVNHFGDIGFYDGRIFTGVEYFVDGRGENIQIVEYDPDTLKPTVFRPWDEKSGQVEVSAITVDTDNGLVWMTDWVNGTHIYAYDLETGDYVEKLHLRATPEWTQGIAFYKGDLYITADDGTADRSENDNLWRVSGDDLRKNDTFIQHELEFTVPDIFKDFGEIEGIDFNRDTNEMLVHSNRGKRIVLGMAKELYPGYEKEIHEVYVFSIEDDDGVGGGEDGKADAPEDLTETSEGVGEGEGKAAEDLEEPNDPSNEVPSAAVSGGGEDGKADAPEDLTETSEGVGEGEGEAAEDLEEPNDLLASAAVSLKTTAGWFVLLLVLPGL